MNPDAQEILDTLEENRDWYHSIIPISPPLDPESRDQLSDQNTDQNIRNNNNSGDNNRNNPDDQTLVSSPSSSVASGRLTSSGDNVMGADESTLQMAADRIKFQITLDDPDEEDEDALD